MISIGSKPCLQIGEQLTCAGIIEAYPFDHKKQKHYNHCYVVCRPMSIEIRLRLRIELSDLLWRQYPLFMRKSRIGKKEERERNNARDNCPAIAQTAVTIPLTL